MPAQAGIQEKWPLMVQLDPGLRRDDSIGRDWGQVAPLAFESAALAASWWSVKTGEHQTCRIC